MGSPALFNAALVSAWSKWLHCQGAGRRTACAIEDHAGGARSRQSRHRNPVTLLAGRIRNGLRVVPADRLAVADCGMKYGPPHVAFDKLKAMGDAAAMGRSADPQYASD
jgi:hypothetical protein